MGFKISHNQRSESFWLRSGFDKFYLKQDIFDTLVTNETKRFPADDQWVIFYFVFIYIFFVLVCALERLALLYEIRFLRMWDGQIR